MSCVDTDRPISQEPSQGPVSEEQSGGGRRITGITGVATKSMELNFGLLRPKLRHKLISRAGWQSSKYLLIEVNKQQYILCKIFLIFLACWPE